MIRLAIAIKNPKTRNHFQELLNSTAPRIGWGARSEPAEVVDLGDEQDKLIDYLRGYFAAAPGRLAVLISDWLVPSDSTPGANTFSERCQATFAENALGMVAIMSHPRRVVDIDRTIGPECDGPLLEQTLTLVIDRLSYLGVPTKRSRIDRTCINVRPLRTTNETEFREYFMLRHRVYTIMGYVDDELVNSRSKLEMNEADLHAIHLGAFYRDGTREKLVGTARVVTNSPANMGLLDLFTAIAGNDPVAKQRLVTPYSLGLPIFQAYTGMNDIITEVFKGNKIEICGELSRVIVAPDFRGNGISQRLIDEALARGINNRGAQRLFLECLQVHETLYQKHGFQRIPGVVGPVVDVERTMIAMQMRTDAIQKIRAGARQIPMAAGI